jgi:hypothetical protein
MNDPAVTGVLVPVTDWSLTHEIQILLEDGSARPVWRECSRRSIAKAQGRQAPPRETEEEWRAQERRVIEGEIDRLQARLRKLH